MPRSESPLSIAREKKDAGGVSWVALRMVKRTAMSLRQGYQQEVATDSGRSGSKP
jgi:hypothetical protein